MSKVYFDTGALVKLYIFESGSAFVQRQAQKANSITINQLQETELRNAIHAAIGRKSIPSAAGLLALEHIDSDNRNGILSMEMLDWPVVWNRAAYLARLHTRKLLCRTLDILHVAAAESCGADLFVTGDKRQFKLANAVGLPSTLVPESRDSL
jgi:predicted nucleic acid-binding protein